jgi:hypothetical protein
MQEVSRDERGFTLIELLIVVLMQVFSGTDNVSGKAVKKDAPSRKWPMYSKYGVVVDEEGGESYVVASTGLFELHSNEADGRGHPAKTYRGRDPERDDHTYVPLRDSTLVVDNNYAPPRVPDLVVELANTADNPITPEVVVDWAEMYGLLASSREKDILERPGLVGLERISGHGCRESVSGFARAAPPWARTRRSCGACPGWDRYWPAPSWPECPSWARSHTSDSPPWWGSLP